MFDTKMSSPNRRCSLCVIALLFCNGCSETNENRAAIVGEVKLDGKLLEQGSILFTPAEGVKGGVAGVAIVNGRYQLSSGNGPSIGWNQVAIHAVRKTGKKVQKPFPAQDQMVDEQVEAIPPRFNSQSILKFEVKSGENTADFAVESLRDRSRPE